MDTGKWAWTNILTLLTILVTTGGLIFGIIQFNRTLEHSNNIKVTELYLQHLGTREEIVKLNGWPKIDQDDAIREKHLALAEAILEIRDKDVQWKHTVKALTCYHIE